MSLVPLAPLLEIRDRFDATDADAIPIVRMRERHLGEAMAEGVAVFEPCRESLRAMEGEDATGTWRIGPGSVCAYVQNGREVVGESGNALGWVAPRARTDLFEALSATLLIDSETTQDRSRVLAEIEGGPESVRAFGQRADAASAIRRGFADE